MRFGKKRLKRFLTRLAFDFAQEVMGSNPVAPTDDYAEPAYFIKQKICGCSIVVMLRPSCAVARIYELLRMSYRK